MKTPVYFHLLSLLAFSISQAEEAGRESSTATDEINDNQLVDPWETPFQELLRITPICTEKIKNFSTTVYKAEVKWQACMDSINPHVPELNKRNSSKDDDDKVNASVYHEIEARVHLSICHNKTVFKSCWTGIIDALNECRPGGGDISGNLYFALYDDICREGGRLTIEDRKKAETQGKLCERDYITDACRMNKRLQKTEEFYDLCKRFKSEVACDQSSFDPDCPNTFDMTSHAEIFQRVGKYLGCYTANHNQNSSSSVETSSSTMERFSWQTYSFIIFFTVVAKLNR